MELLMEFDDIKKIWDTQNNEPLYAINESALHRRIEKELVSSRRANNVSDITLTIISVGVAGFISVYDTPLNVYDYAMIAALLFAVVYIWMNRLLRKKPEEHADKSVRRDLDHAIANVEYEIRRSRTMVWWYIIPLAIPALLNMTEGSPAPWQWVMVSGGFVLSWFVIQWGLTRHLIPQKKNLETIRIKLDEEV
ncbi:MAG: hypothetical protein WD355_10350 [Balneolaceae bacterium]